MREGLFNKIAVRPYVAILLCVLVGLSLKLALALTTFGTNDVTYWRQFMDYIAQHDSVSIYRAIPIYNHPPLMSGYLWLIHFIVESFPKSFPFLMRIPAILADTVTPFLVYRLLNEIGRGAVALGSAMLLGLSPILIFVSGFHGNTDPVFVMAICASLYFLVCRREIAASAMAYGLATNIKIVQVVFLPLIFFAIYRPA